MLPGTDPTGLLLSLNINYWVLQTLAMMLTALLIPGLKITSPFGALATVVSIALINSKVWDAALFFAIPDHLSSQVACLFLANGVIFWILVKLLPGIEVEGIFPALVAPVVFTVSSLFISKYLANVDWMEVWKISLNYIQTAKAYFDSAQISSMQGASS